MEMLIQGLLNSLEPFNILVLVLSMAGGVIVGTLPGLSATMGVALLVPLTFGMDAAAGLLMLGGMYVGAIYGGSNSAILINTPGTPSAICTTFDGFPMTKQGKSGQAMSAALYASAIGGLVGTVFLLVATEPLARFSLRFGPPELFWLAVFGLTIIASLSDGNVIKGLLSGFIGLLMATVGVDLVTGHDRFTFGVDGLSAGFNSISVMIGVFAFTQVLVLIDEDEHYVAKPQTEKGVLKNTIKEITKNHSINLMRSSIIGTIVGIMPGAGGNIAAFVSYNTAKSVSSHPETFGKGELAGIVASESSNNATVSSSLIPLFALSIPGSPVAAVLMGGLLSQGLTPGPKLFQQAGDVAYTFIMGMFLANILLIVVGALGMKVFARVLNVPSYYVAIVVAVLAVIGSYAIRNSMMDVIVMFVSGVIGFYLFKIGLDSGSFILGVILGAIIEKGFSQSLSMASASSIGHVFFGRPISMVLIALCVISIITPYVTKKRRAIRSSQLEGDKIS